MVVNIDLGIAGPVEFITTEDYFGNVGGPGNYLTNLTTRNTKITLNGNGDHYISSSTPGTQIICDSLGLVVLTGDTIGTLNVKSGRVETADNCAFAANADVTTWGETADLLIEASTAATHPHFYRCNGIL